MKDLFKQFCYFSFYMLPISILLIILNFGKCVNCVCKCLDYLSVPSFIAYISIILLLCGLYEWIYIKYNIDHNCSDSDMQLNKEPIIKEFDFIPTMATLLSFVLFSYTDWRTFTYFIVLLVIVFVLFVNTDYFYASPFLAILGYKVYILNGLKNGNEIVRIAISKDELTNGDNVKYKYITNKLVCCYKS